MIRWMITVLIRMAPDTEALDTPIGKIEEDKTCGLGSAILSETTSEVIIDRAIMIFNWLRSLTDLIVGCCKTVVSFEGNNEDKAEENMKKIEVNI